MRYRVSSNAMYRGEDTRKRTGTEWVYANDEPMSGRRKSFYTNQRVYSLLKPRKAADDPTVEERTIHPDLL